MEGGSVHRMCRCCAAEGSFKDIKTTYHWMGDEEVYGDMLSECFDVKLITSDHGGICEMCITHLRNAANFKKQVLETEEQFRKHLESGKFNRPPVVKQEFTMDDEMGESDDNMDNGEDDDYVPDFEVPIKTEDEMDEPVKPRKRACKATTSRAKKSKTEEKNHDNVEDRFDKIEGRLDKIITLLETKLNTATKTEQNAEDDSTEIDLKFPIQSIKDLETLENNLLDKDFENKLVNKFSTFCGRDGSQKIHKFGIYMLNQIIEDECLTLCTWKGIKGCDKIPFISFCRVREMIFKIFSLADKTCSLKDLDAFLQHSAIKHSNQRLRRKTYKSAKSSPEREKVVVKIEDATN